MGGPEPALAFSHAAFDGGFGVAALAAGDQVASAARMRAQLRVPLWKLVRSYFSFGEWTRSSSSAKPTRSVSILSTRLKSATIGIEPPSPIITVLRPHSSDNAARALASG